jgi:hypothetical protein
MVDMDLRTSWWLGGLTQWSFDKEEVRVERAGESLVVPRNLTS